MGSVEIYCGFRFCSPLYSVAVLNLSRSLVFSSSRSFMFFWRPKERKAPALAKSVTTAFCSRVASDIPRLAVVCHKQLSVQTSGTKQLAFHAITTTCTYTAQTNFVLFPMLARLYAVILIVPVSFDITIVRVKFAEYSIAKVIPRQGRKGSVGRHSEQPSNAWKQVA